MSTGVLLPLLISASLLVVHSNAQTPFLFAVTTPDNGTVIDQDEPPFVIMCQPQQQFSDGPVMPLNATWFINGAPVSEFNQGDLLVTTNMIRIFDFLDPSITVSCAAEGFADEILATFTIINPLAITPATAFVAFNSSLVTVSEGVNAVLCINAVFDPPGPGVAELQIITNDVNATAGQDYSSSSVSQRLSIGVTNTVACVSISTFEDDIIEGVETFNATLQLVNSGGILVTITRGTTEVHIVETCLDGEVRLRGGFDEFQGRVEICFNGVWGTVCDDDWDNSDARVVCSQLGYSGPVSRAIPRAAFGPGEGPIFLSSVGCGGGEQRITSCSPSGFTPNRNCFHYEDASVDCLGRRAGEMCPTGSNGILRLVNGQDENQGQVEICYEGTWGKVCGLDWDNNDAQVVCRQLGRSENGARGFGEAVFGPAVGESIVNLVRCAGNETRLDNCPHPGFFESSCDNFQDASVDCLGRIPELTRIGFDSVPPTVGEGNTLEVCVAVLEGTLRFDYEIEVTFTASRPVQLRKRQINEDGLATLGEDFEFSFSSERELFTLGPDNSRFCFTVTVFDDGFPEDTERLAIHLNAFPLSNILLRDQDVQIAIIDNTPRVGYVRTSNPSFVVEGDSVQICIGVVNGTLLGSVSLTLTLGERFFSKRQVGENVPAQFEMDYRFANGGPNIPFTLNTTNTEFCTTINTLQDEIQEGIESISLFLFPIQSNIPVNVEPQQQQLIVFILDDDVVCEDGGQLCIDIQSGIFDCIDRRFICDGRSNCPDGSDERDCIVCEEGQFGCVSENRCLPQEYVCDGIPDCQSFGFFDRDEFNCSTGCVDGELRPLVGGASEAEGIVQVCFKGIFTPLYLEFRNQQSNNAVSTVREASVICQQLGLGNVGIPLRAQVSFGFELVEAVEDPIRGTSRRLVLSCPLGTETRVSQCRLIEGSAESQMGVRCMRNDEPPCIDGSVRLADGPNEREGRVEVCFQNTWGVVSDNDWSSTDAAIVCRQLGFDFNGAVPIYPSLYGAPNNTVQPVVLQNPSCSFEDINLANCRSSFPLGQSDLFGEQAFFTTTGVRCEAYSSALCIDLDVRMALRENPDGTSGLIEICNDGVWSPLAMASVNRQVADVICRQLGFPSGQFNTFSSSELSLSTPPPFAPMLPCSGSEIALSLCGLFESEARRRKRVTESNEPQARLVCNSSPRIILDPPSLDGVYKVELGRSLNVQCRVDARYFPAVDFSALQVRELSIVESSGQFSEPPPRFSKRNVDIRSGPSRSVFSSGSVTVNDSREYVCEATNRNGMITEQSVRIQVLAPEGEAESAFIRFSFPSIERLNETGNVFQSREAALEALQSLIVSYIDVDTPGLQTVDCEFLPSGAFEVERRLDRVECTITQYQIQGEPVQPVSQVAQRLSAAVASSSSIFVLNNTAVNGFCNSEMITTGGLSYLWPEASSGTLVSIPCPSDSSVTVTRRCDGSGQWEGPNLADCFPNVFCEAESVSSVPGEAAIYDWPTTVAGENATVTCINSGDLITRNCALNGEWGPFDDDICGVLDDELEMLLNQTVNNGTYVELTSQLSTILDQSEGNVADQGQRNLGMVAQVFESVAQFVNESDIQIGLPVVQNLAQSMSSLLQWDEAVLINDSSSNIVESFEVVAVLYAQQVEIGEDEPIIIEDLLIVAERSPLANLQVTGRGFTFSAPSENERVVQRGDGDQVTPGQLAEQEDAAIRLPASLFQMIDEFQAPNDNVGIYFGIYDVPSLFPLSLNNTENENRTVGTRVLASTVGPFFDFSNLTEPVSIVLRLTLNTSQRVPGTEMCVSWDFILDVWTDEGCVTGVGSDGVVTCNCTHLTNFAVLVDICSRVDGNCAVNEGLERALSYVSIIGVVLSLVGLVITVITMLIFKKIRQKDASKYHIQLSIAIFCMLLVFIVGIERTENYGGCVTVSVLIHYFTLVAVMWMGAEALLMFQKLVIVFMRITTRYIIILSLTCWLVPLIPVLTPLIVDLATGNDPNDDIVVRQDQFCFLSHPGAFFGAFLALIFLVIIFNFVIFIIVIYVLIKHTRGQLSRQQERMKPATVIRLMISITGVMFLFGLSWLFAALTITVPTVRDVFQALFTVFTSLQGFFIFLFFCVFSKEARESWKEFLSCGKYKSQFLHPSHYKPPTSSAAATRRAYKSAGTGSTGVTSSTLGKPYISETLSKTDYNSESQNYDSEAPKEALDLQKEGRYTDIPLTNGHDSSAKKSFEETPEPEKTVLVETNVDDKPVQPQETVENGKDEKVLKARVKRFSTKKVQKHHVETVEVDFYSDESSEGEEIANL